jgi:hypothetical protein
MKAHEKQAVRFFFAQAGSSYRKGRETLDRAINAIGLARAERHAHTLGWYATWQPDEDGLREWFCECGCTPNDVLLCYLYDADGVELLGVLGGIGDPTAAYQRVIEAELAWQAWKEQP